MIRQAWRFGGIRAEARLAEALFFMGTGGRADLPHADARQAAVRPSSCSASRVGKRGR
ncbi:MULTISPECIES: hypothetical protein [unclassified Paenibacillus]|uniref:hypothetical protein n=1 Tax=unclassified Paenibacillus TaxID=185978 RepID=UPI0012FDC5F2|nr:MULTISPECIES: hypothetical protein [unclassified Paenibacillus]QID16069.1 hypothetical protein CIC07_25410 [Paenibacillus sp. RUD330]